MSLAVVSNWPLGCRSELPVWLVSSLLTHLHHVAITMTAFFLIFQSCFLTCFASFEGFEGFKILKSKQSAVGVHIQRDMLKWHFLLLKRMDNSSDHSSLLKGENLLQS